MEIRRSYDRLISTMGFTILVRCHLYIESGPSYMSPYAALGHSELIKLPTKTSSKFWLTGTLWRESSVDTSHWWTPRTDDLQCRKWFHVMISCLCWYIPDIRFLRIYCTNNHTHSFNMMTSSNGNIFCVMALCVANSPVTGEFPWQRPVTRSFDLFFDLRLNKRLSKQTWDCWFETPPCSLWCHCNKKLYWVVVGSLRFSWY